MRKKSSIAIRSPPEMKRLYEKISAEKTLNGTGKVSPREIQEAWMRCPEFEMLVKKTINSKFRGVGK